MDVCILWGNNYAAPLSEIVRLQNKAIRIINDVPLQEHITPHYVKLGLLKFSDIVKLNTCQFLYDHVYGDKSSELTLILALYLSNIIMPQDPLNFSTSASISIESM